MRQLLDSHVLIWALDDPSRLSGPARSALEEPGNELLISAGTVWELAIKVAMRKLTLALPYKDWLQRAIADLELQVLPLTVDHADRQTRLPWHHRDPFDRLLAAQALVERISLVSADPIFDQYEVDRVWNAAAV